MRQENLSQVRLAVEVDRLDEARVDRDLVYVARGGEDLRADLYRPQVTSGNLPVVLLIHGQSAEPVRDIKNWMGFQDWGRLLASEGFSALIFNQRETGGMLSKRHLAAEDISAAHSFVTSQGPTYGLDSNRVALLAFSAGVPQVAKASHEIEGIRCVVCSYGAMHLEAFRPKLTADAPAEARSALLDFSPHHQLTMHLGAMPPTLVVRAGLDSPVINSSISDYIHEALRLNAPVQLLNVPEARHGFDLLDHTDWSRSAILCVVDFFARHLRPD